MGSTAGSRTTGASTTRAASSAPPTSPSRTSISRAPNSNGRWPREPARSCMRPAADLDRQGGRALASRIAMFDPFWSRVNEAGITVVIHAADSGYTTHGYVPGRLQRRTPSRKSAIGAEHQALQHRARRLRLPDHALPTRSSSSGFPNLRIASIENGAEFLAGPVPQAAPVSRPPRLAGELLQGRSRACSSRSTSGSIPSGKTMSTRSNRSWARIA